MSRLDPTTLRRLHILVDALLVSAGWLMAYGLRLALDPVLGSPINAFASYVHALPLVVGGWISTCWLFGLYRSQRMRTVGDELGDLLRGGALGLLVVSSIAFLYREASLGRMVVLGSAGLNLLFQSLSRGLFHRLERSTHRSGVHDVPALICGTGITAIRLLQKLQDHPEIGYRVVGFLDDDAARIGKDVAGHPVLASPDDLRRVVGEFGIREVFVADPGLGHTRMLSLVLQCEDLGVSFRVVTNLFEVLTAGSPLDLVDDLPLVKLGRQRVHPLYEPCKRVFDLCGALAMGVVGAPLLAWCAWRIRRESPGPAFFVQQRVGRDGEPFAIWKLRTMRPDAPPYETAPRWADDQRITPFGRWLRATSIDELPQLWNVLRGDMSLVGPRPEMPFIAAGYDEWQRRRLSVKPGITGLWQILGRKDLPMHDNLQYDFYYIRNRSLTLDLSILIRTVGVVFSRRGAF